MTQAAVAADLAEALDVHSGLAAQVALDEVVMLNGVTELSLLLLGQVLHPGVGVDAGLGQHLGGPAGSDAVDIGQSNFDPLVAGKINTRNTCHTFSAPPISLVSAYAWGFRKLPLRDPCA